MANPVVRFEIGAADDQPLVKFYGELFGWGLQAVADGYTLVDTRSGSGINGGIGRSQSGEPWATFYVEVDDLQASLDRAEALGGRTVWRAAEPGMVFAMFGDPDGLLVGLQRAGAMEMVSRGPSEGDGAAVDWFEVLGSDAARSQRFYAELFGWTVPQSAYGQVTAGIGGGIGAGGETRWATVYASVADVEATLAKAESLGATRVYGPNQVDDHTQSGAFRDPAGNVFGVYHHGPH
jgi:uncharacterized protein